MSASDSHNPSDARARMATLPLRELTDVLKENARLREALIRIAEQPASVRLGTPWQHWSDIAREALEAGER